MSNKENGQDGIATEMAYKAPIHLWIVDDNARMRATLRELLSHCDGIECTRGFASPNALLSALASKIGPDVILLDIEMGDQNGLDAVRSIRSLSVSTRVLMLTTFFDDQSESRAMADGASGFLLKRYPIEKIVNSIRQACSQPPPRTVRKRQRRPADCTTREFTGSIESKTVTPARAGSSAKRLRWIDGWLEKFRSSRN